MKPNPGRKVLIYQIDADSPRGQKVRNMLRVTGCGIRTVTREEAGQSLGFLLGLPDFEENTQPAEEAPQEEALVFYNFDRKGLDQALAALKRGGVQVPLKAVVTEHNRGWSVARLLEELAQEHRLMKSWNTLASLVKKSKKADKELVKEAKELLSSHAPSEEALEELIARLEEAERA